MAQQPEYKTIGDVAKASYDIPKNKAVRGLWERVREVGLSGFGKGVLIAGAAVIGVMALVTGFMGAEEARSIGSVAANNFENGVGQGISKALEFLMHPLGLGVLAAGGAAGVASSVIHNQHKNAAEETKRMSLEFERVRDQTRAQEQQKAQAHSKEHEADHKAELEKAHAKQHELEEKLKAAAKEEHATPKPQHDHHEKHHQSKGAAATRLENAAGKLEHALAHKEAPAPQPAQESTDKAAFDKINATAERLEKAAASLERATEKLATQKPNTAPKPHSCPPSQLHQYNYLDHSRSSATANVFKFGGNEKDSLVASASLNRGPQPATLNATENPDNTVARAKIDKAVNHFQKALSEERIRKTEAKPELGLSS